MQEDALEQLDQDDFDSFSNDTPIKLGESELLCDKCKGKGVVSSSDTLSQLARVCPKCQGDGKVDWISNIT